ncbi:hypothetical protein SH2C18_02790 [Clostridium sediminicola]|uniref:holin n=1 Tax=Clostridium sediminicola TaxID=3114879 RepID=UPI0031F1E926
MDRFKNYGLWVSIAAFIPLILEAFGFKIMPGNYNEIINSLLGILVLAGIINNPQNGKGYLNEKNTEKENFTEKDG